MMRKYRREGGFTLVEIMIVVAIIGLLVAIALPNFITARNTARQNLCDNNMRLIGHGAEQYIIDNNLDSDTVVTEAQAGAYVKGGTNGAAFRCPNTGDDQYTIDTETVGGESGPTVTCASHGRTYHVLTGEVD